LRLRRSRYASERVFNKGGFGRSIFARCISSCAPTGARKRRIKMAETNNVTVTENPSSFSNAWWDTAEGIAKYKKMNMHSLMVVLRDYADGVKAECDALPPESDLAELGRAIIVMLEESAQLGLGRNP
jgi:hypothetical protein